MGDGEAAERHGRSQRPLGLVADALLGNGRRISGPKETWNGTPSLVDHLPVDIRQQADR
jgi:hypothetical protein